jgi:hypothetical protein
MLGENNRGGLPFDDPTGRWISDLTGYRVAFGRFQVKPSQKYLKFSDQAIWLSLSVG